MSNNILRIIFNKILQKASILSLAGSIIYTAYTADIYSYDTHMFYYFLWLNIATVWGSISVIAFILQEWLKIKTIKKYGQDL
jgi:hypothetical protein